MLEKLSKAASNPDKVVPYLRRKAELVTWRRHHNTSRQVSIAGYSAEFQIETQHDFRIIHDLSERDVLNDLLAKLTPDDTFWDVGANIGLYSCLAGKVGADIVAIEPDESVRSMVQRNLQTNQLDGDVLPYGLSDTKKTFAEDLNTDRDPSKTTIEAVDGEQLIAEDMAPKPTVIKIDIEGMELSALRGLSQVIDDVRLIYVEIHPEQLRARDESQEEVEEWLRERGYSLSVVQPFDGANLIVRGMRA